MLDIDGLPDNGQLILVEAGCLEQITQFLVGFQQARCLGHDGVEVRDDAHAFLGASEDLAAFCGGGVFGVAGKFGHLGGLLALDDCVPVRRGPPHLGGRAVKPRSFLSDHSNVSGKARQDRFAALS